MATTQKQKTASSSSSARKRTTKSQTTPTIDRQKMVSEAAYYLAEQRGFEAGGELGDWLEAEQQIDIKLSH